MSRDNVNKALELFLSIINAGITVVTLIDNAEYRADTDPHRLMSQMMISLAIFLRANDESRTKSARKAASWKYKREAAAKGAYHGGRLPAWIRVDAHGKYQVVEAEAAKVRKFFADYVAGKGFYVLSREMGLSTRSEARRCGAYLPVTCDGDRSPAGAYPRPLGSNSSRLTSA